MKPGLTGKTSQKNQYTFKEYLLLGIRGGRTLINIGHLDFRVFSSHAKSKHSHILFFLLVEEVEQNID